MMPVYLWHQNKAKTAKKKSKEQFHFCKPQIKYEQTKSNCELTEHSIMTNQV